MVDNLTPAKFLQIVDKVYAEASPLFPIYEKKERIYTDIFEDHKKYKAFKIYTFNRRNFCVYIEFVNGFVRVYIEGTDTGAAWSIEQLEEFSLGAKAAYTILDACNQAGANQI